MWAAIDSNNVIWEISPIQYTYMFAIINWIEWADSPEDFIRENIKLWRYTPEGIFVKNTESIVIEPITPVTESNIRYALVSPGNEYLVVQIEEVIFDVANPFFWVECSDTCKTGMYYIDGKFVTYVPPPPNAAENKNKAINLLKETDWSTYSDVINIYETPHLINQNEFIEYRRKVRIISLKPTDGNLVWPIKPIEIWSESPSGPTGPLGPTGTTIEVLRETN
jgi:hypothetical protein